MEDGPDRDFLGGRDMQIQVDPAGLFVEIRIGVNDDDADADARHDAVRRRADPAIRPGAAGFRRWRCEIERSPRRSRAPDWMRPAGQRPAFAGRKGKRNNRDLEVGVEPDPARVGGIPNVAENRGEDAEKAGFSVDRRVEVLPVIQLREQVLNCDRSSVYN